MIKKVADGMERETEILNIASKYTEDEIHELISKDSRYFINNAFSPVRRNLLDWYPFKKDCSILEVCGGTGSLTGLLCEKAKKVTSVEMSAERAETIKARNAERDNLNVVCGDINSIDADELYDYAVMVGEVEYNEIFSDSNTPFYDFFAKLRSLLKPDGVLLFATENQYGLKYWLGAADEHSQKPFVALQGHSDPKTAKTFSKADLEQMCSQLGFDTRFYYLLPDYKFPTAIFTDESLPSYHDLINPKYAYYKNSCLTADERKVYRGIVQNKVFPFFANAYLVEASASLPERYITRVSARSEVVSQQRIITAIDNKGGVFKLPQNEEAATHIKNIVNNEKTLATRGVKLIPTEYDGVALRSEFCHEKIASDVFSEALGKGDVEKVKSMIEAMESALRKSSDIHFADGEEILEHGYVDMTFYNAFWIDNDLVFFDQEWDFANLPLKFVLYYGLKIAYERTNAAPVIPFEFICEHIGVSDATAKKYDEMENALWGNNFLRGGDIYGGDGYYNQFGVETFDEVYNERNGLVIECKELNEKITRSEEAREKIKSELNNRESECQQLREKENMYLDEIRTLRCSRSYRLGQKFAKVLRFFIPIGSKRAVMCKLIFKVIRHPIAFLRSFSIVKFKKFFKLLSGGNTEYLNEVINNRIVPSMIELKVPEIIPVDLNANKSFEDYAILNVPQWTAPLVSIIIPVYNQFEYTYHCVESIMKNSGDVSYEIIIANDCSTDLTTRIEEILVGVKCVTNEQNLRFLKNCNNAAKYATGKYVLFLNNDTQVQHNWLKPLVTLIESADDIGMVGSKLIYPDGKLQEAGGILWRDGSAWNYGNGQNPAQPEFNYVKQVDYMSGAAIMLERALWEEIGGFDEYFAPAYCEDSDLAFTVRKMGYRVMYQPLSVVVHFEGVSNGTNTATGQKKYQIENSEKFRKKWKEELDKHPENSQNVFQARDYSYGKKTLLMVDHYVPQFDKDAGSRTVFQYLKLFAKAGFNVKFIGDNFYQHEPYTTALQQMGIEVLYGPDYANHWKNWVKENAGQIDYVFLNRPHIAPKYLDFLRENTSARIIYYGHDLAFMREMREYEVTGDESFKTSSEEWKPKEIELMKKADVAYYPSYVEVDEIHKIDESVNVKAIPAYIFEDIEWRGYDFESRRDIMFIGGFAHRPNVDAVKWLASELLPRLVKLIPDIKVHVLGSNPPKEVLELANENLIMEGFVTDEQLEAFYLNSRISLIPLRYGAGIKGKVVEAMRYGTPVVTTSVGSEGIPNAESAMLVEDDVDKLAAELARLYEDKEKLTYFSQNSVAYVKNNYSPDNAINIIGKDFGLE